MLTYFHQAVKERNEFELNSIYENDFLKITERYYKNSFLPPVDSIAPLVENDEVFLILYKELYYRHIYSLAGPKFMHTIEHRFGSWDNYCQLFDNILNTETPLDLVLPTQWLWDMTDEFIYQFQSFSQYRTKLKKNI